MVIYEDFEDCVSQNQEKEDPQAFCAWLYHEITGEWLSEKGGKTVNETVNKFMDKALKAVDLDNELSTLTDEQLNELYSDIIEMWNSTKLKSLEDFGVKLIATMQTRDITVDQNTEFAKAVISPTHNVAGRSKVESWEHLISTIQRAVWRTFDRHDDTEEPNRDMYVVHTFDDAVVVHESYSNKLYEATYFINGDEVIFGELKEVEERYVLKRLDEVGAKVDLAKKREDNRATQIGGPIVRKNAALRIAHAAVLVPGEPDSDGEVLSAEKIEQVAHEWMDAYRNVDLMHTLNNVGNPVESYITPVDLEVEAYGQKMILPKGTWILASKLQPETWEAVEQGMLTGYSVMGIKRSAMEIAAKSKEDSQDMAFKRTLLADLGPDWVAAFVSVVDEPAVPKAKFFALKSREYEQETPTEQEQSPQSFFAKLKGALGMDVPVVTATSVKTEAVAVKEGRKFSNDTYQMLKSAVDSLGELLAEAEAERASKSAEKKEEEEVNDMDEAKLKEIIDGAVKAAVTPLAERIEELETSSKAAEPAEEDVTNEDSAQEQAEKSEEKTEEEAAEKSEEHEESEEEELSDESFKSAVLERLDTIEKKQKKVITASKSLPTDGKDKAEKSTESKPTRDAFGRRIR